MKLAFYSSLHIFVCLFVLLSFQHFSFGTSNLIRQSCQEVAKTDPNLSYKFCVTTLEANPKSKNATSLKELAIISIELTISNATEIHSYILKLLRQKLAILDPYVKTCLRDCLELYSDAISSLRDANHGFQRKDFERVNLEISSAMDAPTLCEGGFGERKGAVSPLTWENQLFFQWAVISLAFTTLSAHK